MAIIKEIKQKTGTSNFLPFPIGVDSLNVNMNSQLDLQEQLKLGSGNKYTKISSKEIGGQKIITIIEYFGDLDAVTCNPDNSNFSSSHIKNTLYTQIYDTGLLANSESNYMISVNEENVTNPIGGFVISSISSLPTNLISYTLINLYNGYVAQNNITASSPRPIHQKLTSINSNTVN